LTRSSTRRFIILQRFLPLRCQSTSTIDNVAVKPATRTVITIPVSYGGEFGPDLEFVATYNGMIEDEVVPAHTSTSYLVYMLGFTPGFPYLGGMSERIAASRLELPRVNIPAGFVGIAGKQTGIYPIESPGGWRQIGRTPLRLFDPMAEHPFLVASGDYLQFRRAKSRRIFCPDGASCRGRLRSQNKQCH